ncbi:MAG TPA: hypothetical protein VJH20_03425 [Candidatus Nanoarchaeia archaeon]|nr:hypothetical protein [Candidatus Nanoarchaeia archaeon]
MTEAQKRIVMALAFIIVVFSLYILLFDQSAFTGNTTRGSSSTPYQWLIFWIVFPFVLLVVLFAVVTLVERNKSSLLQGSQKSRRVSRNSVSSSRLSRSRSRRR